MLNIDGFRAKSRKPFLFCVLRDIVENPVQRSDPNRAMPRNNNMVLATQPGRKFHMTALLANNCHSSQEYIGHDRDRREFSLGVE